MPRKKKEEAQDTGETLLHNTVNEDVAEEQLEEGEPFVGASREEVVGDPVISNNLPDTHADVGAGPHGDVESNTNPQSGKRSDAQLRARKAVESYEQAKRERRGL